MEKAFLGKKALVVGGTGGIGRAVTLGLAERGADLTIHGGSSKERLENTLKAVRETGATGEGFLLPISGPESAKEIFSRADGTDILVCAWGPFRRKPLEALDCEFWQSMVMGNLIFPGALVSLALPGMIKQNWGRILLFGGTNTDTIRGYSTSTAYSAAKTALGVIAKSIAKCGSGHITCNVVCPGLTNTEYLDENELQYNREKSPCGKPLVPEDIARICMDILENPGINGAIIPVDSGICI
jgi:NAD(P)-dependent dehydrogenase (short-subunit alcohol dehydrogenase family)